MSRGKDCLNTVVVSPSRCDIVLPPAVCENGQHTGNPHCPVIETPDVSAVPLPAAGWLFISALIAVFGLKRLRGTNNGGNN